MAYIKENKLKDGGSSWQVSIRIAPHKPIVESFATKAEADRFIDIVERPLIAASQARKNIIANNRQEKKRNPTFADFMNESVADIVKAFVGSSEAKRRHKCSAPVVIATVCRSITINDLRKSWVKDYTDRMLKKKTRVGKCYSYESIAAQIQLMSTAIRWRSEELAVPFPALPLNTKQFPANWQNRRERRLVVNEFINEEEIILHRLLDIDAPSRQHWAYLMKLALETGARLQELVLAEWREFDIERRVWTIPASHTKGKRARAIPLSIKATNCVCWLRDIASATDPRVFHLLGDPDSVSRGFHLYVMSTGIQDFRFHDLRHEACARMVLRKRELSVFEIMKIMGHTSTAMLHRYANLRADELVERMG